MKFFKKKKLLYFLFTFVLLISIILWLFFINTKLVTHNVTEIYISIDGDDAGSGDKNSPYKSFDKVLEKINSLLENENFTDDINVILREGTYYLNNSINIAISSIPSDNTITFKSYKKEKAIISGGTLLNNSNFTLLNDEKVINFLSNENAAKNIYVYSLADLDLNFNKDENNINYAPQLLINSEPMTLSRYPNTDYLYIKEVIDNNDKNYTFKYDDEHLTNFKTEDNVYINGYISQDWDFTTEKINSINTINSTININKKLPYGIEENCRFYISNSLQELDNPGEYYIDYTNSLLYVIPPDEGIENSVVEISLLTKPLIKVIDSKNISFENIDFSNCRANGIEIENSSNININSCNIYNITENAIVITNGNSNSVNNCNIYYTGAGGIRVDAGDRETLTSSNMIINNNHIFNYAKLFRTYNAAITIRGVGITASNNTINNAPHLAIIFSGNDHIIENNEIFDVTQETNDAGAIYSGRNWTSRGNIIRGNYIHDNYNNIDKKFTWGIYLDDCMSAANIYDNFFENLSGGILAGGGNGITIKNNTFSNCYRSVMFDERGLTADLTELKQRLEEVPYESDIWIKKYPELKESIEKDPRLPINNTIIDNSYYNSMDFDIADSVIKYGTIKNNKKLDSKPNK